MSEKRKEANYGFGSNFKSEEVRNLDMLIDAIKYAKDADAIRILLEALYDYYYYAKQTNKPDNELYKIINYLDSNKKDIFKLIEDPNIREKAREIIPNEVEIKTSGDISELISCVYKIGNIKGSKDTYTPEDIKDIILALSDYYSIGSNKDAKPEYYSKIESTISKNEDPFEWLPRTYGIREKARMLIKPKDIINETYAKLEEGDFAVNSSAGGYYLYITYDEEFYKLKKEADKFVEGYNGIDRIKKLNEFVYYKIKYDPDWNNKPVVSISDAIKNLRGVCKEYAAILYMLLASDGYKVYYVRGTLKGERHAWVKVDINGESYLLDPTNNYFGLYKDVLLKEQLEEGENKIGWTFKTLPQIRRT